jgi:annexin A7/11
MTSSAEYFEPTVRPVANFNAQNDAKSLRSAMKGLGTNEKVIIDILTQRSSFQRQEIIAAFKHEFGRDLVADLTSELGGKLEKVILALMETSPNYLAGEIHRATAKIGTDEDVLSEIFCSLNNNDLAQLSAAFQARYGKRLEKVIESEVSGDYKRLLVLLVNRVRGEGNFRPERAREQAQDLYKAGEGVFGTDEEKFVVMLTHESFDQLRYILDEYHKISGKTLEQAVNAELSGYLKTAVLTIIKCAQGRAQYFAEKLEKAMKGAGTDDETLIRIIVTRAELDLGAIKKAYQNLYHRTLYSSVKSETSGDYKAVLLALIGEA